LSTLAELELLMVASFDELGPVVPIVTELAAATPRPRPTVAIPMEA
jgi:hypothetical protein